MKTCCEHHNINCNQGRNCPARANTESQTVNLSKTKHTAVRKVSVSLRDADTYADHIIKAATTKATSVAMQAGVDQEILRSLEIAALRQAVRDLCLDLKLASSTNADLRKHLAAMEGSL